jgi:hypothetical protein
MEEKIFKTKGVSFHGECTIVRADLLGIDSLPEDAKELARDENGQLMVAHSESGHHHVIDSPGVRLYKTDNPLISFLQVEMDAHALLRHAKPAHDPQRHGTQILPSGLYRISIQREATPAGWRKVMD